MEGEYFQIFATPRTGTHLSALRRCALQPWQRRSSDARRATQAAISLARVAAAARARGRGESPPGDRAAPSSSLAMGVVLRMVWLDLGRLGRLVGWGRLAEVTLPLRRRFAERYVLFYATNGWMK